MVVDVVRRPGVTKAGVPMKLSHYEALEWPKRYFVDGDTIAHSGPNWLLRGPRAMDEPG